MSIPGLEYRPSIFVASSGASKAVAEAVKDYFAPNADVEVWTDGVFQLNESTLQTLLNRASYNDFFIAIFAADDEAVVKGEKKMLTRANVVFEFGLFLGRIGLDRTFFLLETGADLFSDWEGMTVTRFTRGDDLTTAVADSCSRIAKKMAAANSDYDFTVLPSTSLAVGYFHNFLDPVLKALVSETSFNILRKDKDGNVIRRFSQIIKDHAPTIEIHAPHDLRELERERLRVHTNGYTQVILETSVRPFPFYVQGKFGPGARLHLFDIPTTLYASYRTICEFFSVEFLKTEGTLQRLMYREIRNFELTLSKLIPDSIERTFYRFEIY